MRGAALRLLAWASNSSLLRCVLMGDFNFGEQPGGAAERGAPPCPLPLRLRSATLSFGSKPGVAEYYPHEVAELRRHPEFIDAWSRANGSAGFTWDNGRNPMNKVDPPGLPNGFESGQVGFNSPSARVDRILLRGRLQPISARLVNDLPLPCGSGASMRAHCPP